MAQTVCHLCFSTSVTFCELFFGTRILGEKKEYLMYIHIFLYYSHLTLIPINVKQSSPNFAGDLVHVTSCHT